MQQVHRVDVQRCSKTVFILLAIDQVEEKIVVIFSLTV